MMYQKKVRSLSFLLILVFVPAVILAQADRTSGVSVSETFLPDLSIFPKLKDRKKKEAKKGAEPAPPPVEEQRSIWLPVSILDKSGVPISNVTANEVEIFLNGEKYEIREFKYESVETEVVFVVDTSPSLAYKIEDVQSFLETVISNLPADRKIEIWKFDAEPKVMVGSTLDRVAIRKAIRKLEMNGGTSLYDTVSQLCEVKGKDRPHPRVVLLISDGVDTTSKRTDAPTSLLRTNECNDIYFPVYLDTFKFHSDRLKKFPGNVVGVPGFPSVLAGSAQAVNKAEYDLGRQYLTMLFKLSGGGAYVFPASKADLDRVAAAIDDATKTFYSFRIDVKPTSTTNPVRVVVKRPDLRVLTRSVISVTQ